MRYHALAVDYDGTLATAGFVDDATVDALVRLRETGRRIVLVTGRLLKPLLDAFPQVGLCDLVVAENGALLYDPDTKTETPLAEAPPREFVEKLAERGVDVDEVGRVIIATHVPHETRTLETIRDMALELQIIFNKGAVMILPAGVNKATGLERALYELELSRHNCVAAGDAENDLAFLNHCEASTAVANALDSVKNQVDVVLDSVGSEGVVELIDRLIADDLADVPTRPERELLLGATIEGVDVRAPHHARVLIVGDSASGKSTLALSLLSQLVKNGFQTCVIDPEGDYQSVKEAIVLGTRDQTPTVEEVMQVLAAPDKSCVVSLFATKVENQPEYFSRLYRALSELRLKTGRPHWLLVDEAHYPLAASWAPIEELHLEEGRGVICVTAAADQLPAAFLGTVDVLVAMSADDPLALLRKYCELVGEPPAELGLPADGGEHRAILWRRGAGPPFWLRRLPAEGEHQRHRHQYFDGEMDPADQFYFRGPKGELNLGAKNLRTFMELARGVGDETWLFHLRRGDYVHWFRDKIQDDQLARLAERHQDEKDMPANESRQQIDELIQKLYVREL